MPTLKIAHIQRQGQNMIIVPLANDFGHKTQHDQSAAIDELQGRAGGAGLAGTVVPVWDNGGRMAFIAPKPWHPYFSSINLRTVYASVNKTLSW